MTSIGARQIEFLDRNRTISTTHHMPTLNDMSYVNKYGETNHSKHTHTNTMSDVSNLHFMITYD